MFLQADDQATYPVFTNYVYNSFPGVTQSTTIMKNISAIGKLSPDYFRATLIPGMPPNIVIVDRDLKGRATSDELGKLKGGCPAKIYLAKHMVERFDYEMWAHSNYFFAKNKALAPIVGGVLLHMLCHYGHYLQGILFDPHNCPGLDFEKETYGSYTAVEFLV
jgi:hypothetical protein